MIAARVRFFIPFVISAALLALVVNSVRGEADQLGAALGAADWRLILPAIGLYFLGVWLRSARWGLLLPEHHLDTPTLFQALVVGFTINNLLPLRMGEVARAYLLSRWRRVPYGATIASLVVERVLDGLSLAVLLLAALSLLPAPGYLLAAGVVAAAGFLAGAALLAVAAWRASAVIALAAFVSRPLPRQARELVVGLTTSFARSLALVHAPGRLGRLLGLSLLAWCSELGLFFVLLVSFGLPASYPLALLVGSAANFATLIPSSPGYVGTFDGVLVNVLRDTAGVAAGQALAYDLVVHAALFLPVVLVGTLVLWRSHVSLDQITHATRPAPEAGLATLSSRQV
ncbi:MAG TPA: lysylphosphatidylglycerol synthase transmembrane domain-containing protein [Chloroflexota bacterium]